MGHGMHIRLARFGLSLGFMVGAALAAESARAEVPASRDPYAAHVYRYAPERIGFRGKFLPASGAISQALSRDYVFRCRNDGTVEMEKDFPADWAARNNGLQKRFERTCRQEIQARSREIIAIRDRQDREERESAARTEESDERVAAYEKQQLVALCLPYFAEPTSSFWDSDPSVARRCRGLASAERGRAAKSGEAASGGCAELVSVDRGEAWRLSREANRLSAEGRKAEALAKYREAEAALASARRGASGAGQRRCILASDGRLKGGAEAGSAGQAIPEEKSRAGSAVR